MDEAQKRALEEELRKVNDLARDLAKILAHPSARADHLAVAWPVTDETFLPYAAAMYRLLAARSTLLGLKGEDMTDKSDSSPEDDSD